MTVAPPVQWVTASPLWQDAVEEPPRFRRPAILRYEADTFMGDLAADLARRPEDLVDRVAEPRSYRSRPVGTSGTWEPKLPELKLYQPAQGHFNLVAASLVCRMPGMPERTVDTDQDETVAFVLRRLVPAGDTALTESAWVVDGTGPGWRTVGASGRRVLPGEELLPLFPVNFRSDGPRRLFVGLIPTSSADSFKAAGALSPAAQDLDKDGQPVDPRMDDFETRVFTPLDALRAADWTGTSETGAERDRIIRAGDELRFEASRFLLLDLAELVQAHAPSAWQALQAASPPPSTSPAFDLHDVLEGAGLGIGSMTVRAALVEAARQSLLISEDPDRVSGLDVDLTKATALDTDEVRRAVRAALPATPAVGAVPPRPDEAAAASIPKLHPSGALFLLRCVFRRPRCDPFPFDIVSEPSEPFAIASFFDADAPARTIRVELPLQTTIADLRRYPKNVGFVISNQLREQMSRVTDLEKVMKGQLASGDSFDIGLLCSFSIPIITICALIVLLIFVSLLNIVFWWMPFLRICLPIALPKRT